MIDPCRDWRGALGAAALGRIDPAEEIGLRAHLDGCAECRTELQELTAVAGALAAVPVVSVITPPAEPSAALAARVLARVTEARGARRTRHRRRFAAAAGAFAAAAAIVVAIVLVAGPSSPGGGTRVAIPGVGKGRDARATATLRPEAVGTAIDMKVAGLRPGHYYWLWLTGDDGHRIPAGTFSGSRGTSNLRLTVAVPLSEARRIWVTDDHHQVVLDAPVPLGA